VFADLAARYPPSRVNDPESPEAAANGQYLLIAREAYDAVGGVTAVATSLLEDVALARAIKQSGRRIYFRYGGDAVRTRMYRSFAQMQEGWTKNLALLFPSLGWLAALRMAEFATILMGLGFATGAAMAGAPRFAGVVGAAAILLWVLVGMRLRRSNFRWHAIVLGFFGLPVFAYLLLRSRRFHRQGRVSWKGRSYSGLAVKQSKG